MSIGQFMPMMFGEIFEDAYSIVLSTDSGTSYSNRMVRMRIPAARLLRFGSGVQLHFSPKLSGAATVVQNVYIGKPNGALSSNFLAGSAVQCLFSGATGFTIAAGSSGIWSDTAEFEMSEGEAVLVSIGFANVTQQARTTGAATGVTAYYYDGGGSIGSANSSTSSDSTNSMITLDGIKVRV